MVARGGKEGGRSGADLEPMAAVAEPAWGARARERSGRRRPGGGRRNVAPGRGRGVEAPGTGSRPGRGPGDDSELTGPLHLRFGMLVLVVLSERTALRLRRGPHLAGDSSPAQLNSLADWPAQASALLLRLLWGSTRG